MSDASGTLWLDGAARKWSGELLALTHLTAAQMPALCEGNAPARYLRQDMYQQSRQLYGRRRLVHALRQRGYCIYRKRV